MVISASAPAKLLIGLAMLGLVPLAAADEQIFRSVDENGHAVFSDTPPPSSERAQPLKLPEMNEYDSERPAYLGKPGAGADRPTAPVSYRTVRISTPANDEAIRNNAGNVHIEAATDPQLAPGHTLQLVMDGEVVAANTSGAFDLVNVDRGTHQLEARIIDDATGEELAHSEPTTFHLKRHFIRRKN